MFCFTHVSLKIWVKIRLWLYIYLTISHVLQCYRRCENIERPSSSIGHMCFSFTLFLRALLIQSQSQKTESMWQPRLRALTKAVKEASQTRADSSEGQGLWWVWRPSRLIRNSELRARESAFHCDFITDWLCDIKVVISVFWLPCWQNDEEWHKLNPKIPSSAKCPWLRHLRKPAPVPNSQRTFR